MKAARILLVEDEEALRQLLAKYLVRLDFEVEATPNAEEAWNQFSRDPAHYSLLLIDLTLPGMPGDELMRRALAASPVVRVLLSSGFPYELGGLPPEFRSRAAFLQKPYLPRQLADQINTMLRAAGLSATK